MSSPPSRLRAVVVYSRAGGGHLSAARAIADELEATGRCTARIVDAYVECGRFPVTLFPAIYAQLARHHPRVWWAIYYGSSKSRLSPNSAAGPFLRAGFRQLIAREQPDLVISVLPAVNGLLAEATARNRARLEVVLTDWHSVHPFWVALGVRHYIAPTDSARLDCIRFGAAADAVDVIGIPVRREFVADLDQAGVRVRRLTELGLDPRQFTILMMVGADGSPRALRNIGELTSQKIDAQLVVICGRSDELRAKVERLPSRIPLRALGFVNDVADLMRSADLLVSKPGGLSLAEAFCSGLPVVIDDALPGQEAGNLEYVLAQGAVEYAARPEDLVEIVSALKADPRRRAQLAAHGKRLARPDAARHIARNALARLEASRTADARS